MKICTDTRTQLVILGISFLISLRVLGVPADPNYIKFKQPDGSYVTIILKGDEKRHWAESMDGYTLLTNNFGGWEYAKLDSSGNLICSGLLARDIRKRSCREKKILRRIPKKLIFVPK